MTENQEPYGTQVTFTGLSNFFISTFCMPKIMRDAHKDDPLQREIESLKVRGDEERTERLQAFRRWQSSKTEKNAAAFLDEIADEINFLLFQAGKVLEYNQLIRE